ncbi:hypothetical protein FG167_14425 [Lacinutrix sp. WUR7]|uniref:hypothetical protein n=1 Tax=Lacinutrix sp. WUR7 TaxID=2653681 RepID=UPI00193E2420|nr:hypothetical protein [Lacinutrix sp. WUR7]QRM90381.1 hypothetical protein FG167_14425 [Lacinutrix sp. WUR7]
MKNTINSSFVVVLLIVSTLFSCSTNDMDDNQNETNTLVGEWQRADSNSSFANGFVFLADNTGVQFTSENHDDGTAISNAVSLEWNSSGTNLQLMMDEEINTSYSFNAEGELLLSAISEIPFVRID